MSKRHAQQLKLNELLTPEEILARSRKNKLRFRSAIRFVMQNLYWLGDTEDSELGDDVQKNIMLLTRKKGQTSLLSLQDKGILSKPAEHRTDDEKLHLGRIISGLKCFQRYPSEVKKQLAGVTYFYYFGPGRTIVRQDHESMALYFIITGILTVSQKFFDPVLNEMVSTDVGTMGPGNMFGEFTLLHDIPRTNTVTSNTHVELLCLKKNDFNVVLKATVQEHWDAVRNAMDCFTYFDDWDKTIIRDCCILGKINTFRPGETMLGDRIGFYNYVYFMLSGRCQIIEHILVSSEIRRGKKCYKQYPPPLPVETSTLSGTDLFEAEAKTKFLVHKENETKEKCNEAEEKCNDTSDDLANSESRKSEQGVTFTSGGTCTSQNQSSKKQFMAKLSASGATKSVTRSSSRTSVATDKKPSVRTAAAAAMTPLSSRNTPVSSDISVPHSVETHFMQVCFLNATACFNIGENINHRRIVATTFTKCLLIPRYWLIQHNKGNIWNRVRQFLDSHIPTTNQVFKAFVKQRQWMAYRKKVLEDATCGRKKISGNNINNVPYFIRINEEIDL